MEKVFFRGGEANLRRMFTVSALSSKKRENGTDRGQMLICAVGDHAWELERENAKERAKFQMVFEGKLDISL